MLDWNPTREGARLQNPWQSASIKGSRMADRMDRLIAAAVSRGLKVWPTKRGAWVFAKASLTVTGASTSTTTAIQWVRLIGGLRGVGLVFPDPDGARSGNEEEGSK